MGLMLSHTFNAEGKDGGVHVDYRYEGEQYPLTDDLHVVLPFKDLRADLAYFNENQASVTKDRVQWAFTRALEASPQPEKHDTNWWPAVVERARYELGLR